MDNKSFIPDNIPADLEKSWHIPRPTLARSSKSSQGSPSSNNSTQSAKSGSLLLTAANLAQIQASTAAEDAISTRQQNIQLYLDQNGTTTTKDDTTAIPVMSMKKPDPDSVSVASSMHFTVVNMNTRSKVRQRSFCRKHQLTILVMTMSALITIGIIAAVFYMEMRAKNQRH